MAVKLSQLYQLPVYHFLKSACTLICTFHLARFRGTSFNMSHVMRDSRVCKLGEYLMAGVGGCVEPVSLSPGPAVGPNKHAGPTPHLRPTEAEYWEAEAL